MQHVRVKHRIIILLLISHSRLLFGGLDIKHIVVLQQYFRLLLMIRLWLLSWMNLLFAHHNFVNSQIRYSLNHQRWIKSIGIGYKIIFFITKCSTFPQITKQNLLVCHGWARNRFKFSVDIIIIIITFMLIIWRFALLCILFVLFKNVFLLLIQFIELLRALWLKMRLFDCLL